MLSALLHTAKIVDRASASQGKESAIFPVPMGSLFLREFSDYI